MDPPEEATLTTYYGGLNAGSVKAVISPHTRGADDDLINDFLAEAELDVINEIGALPSDVTTSPGYDVIIRSVIRDLAGARTILKLVGTDNDEGRRAGMGLDEYAWNRLLRWTESRSDSFADGPEGSGYLHNRFEQPLYNDPKTLPERRLGGEWPGA